MKDKQGTQQRFPEEPRDCLQSHFEYIPRNPSISQRVTAQFRTGKSAQSVFHLFLLLDLHWIVCVCVFVFPPSPRGRSSRVDAPDLEGTFQPGHTHQGPAAWLRTMGHRLTLESPAEHSHACCSNIPGKNTTLHRAQKRPTQHDQTRRLIKKVCHFKILLFQPTMEIEFQISLI